KALAEQLAVTNGNIAAGANGHVKRMPSGHLAIKTPKQDEVDAGALSRYFPQRHFVPLTEILATIDGAAGFSGEPDPSAPSIRQAGSTRGAVRRRHRHGMRDRFAKNGPDLRRHQRGRPG